MEQFLNNLAEEIAILPFLIGVIFTIVALIMLRFPPKKINYLYGYRTFSSMKNQQVWDFSQKFSSIQMLKGGIFLLVTSFLSSMFNISETQETIIGMFIMISIVVYLLITTERAIKKNFPNQEK